VYLSQLERALNQPTSSSDQDIVLNEPDQSPRCAHDQDSVERDIPPVNGPGLPNDGTEDDFETVPPLLFPSAQISRIDAMHNLMQFRRTYKTSDRVFEGVLSLVDSLLPSEHTLPATNFLFRKEVGVSEVNIDEHLFCRAHRIYIGRTVEKKQCAACEEEGFAAGLERFFTFDIGQSFSELLNNETFTALLKRRTEPSQMSIKDGKLYPPGDSLSIALFMDGTRYSKKTTGPSITVISLVCNELPSSHRFNFARPAMIYVGEVKADANILLEPIIDQLHHLNVTGVSGHKIRTIVCVADAPAKCEIQGFRQYNASDVPCTSCRTTGEPRQQLNGPTVFPYFGTDAPARTHNETTRDAVLAVELLGSAAPDRQKEIGVNGVKFPSQLLRLDRRNFDIIRSCPHEIMHIMMGVCDQTLTILLDVDISSMPISSIYR